MKFPFLKPHLFRGGFFYALLSLFATLPVNAQFKFREPPNREQPEALSAENGERVWEWFLLNRQVGRFTLNGELTYRPSGAPSLSRSFQLEADWQGICHNTVIQLSGTGGVIIKSVQACAGEYFLLEGTLQNETRIQLDAQSLSDPVQPELPFSWMDILMPYLDWKTVSYVGPDRYLGRPAHKFELLNPDPDASPARVVVTIDEDYAALLEAELFEASGFLAKRMRIGGFKKFGEQWMFSELNWENRRNRSSVRLKVYSFQSTNF